MSGEREPWFSALLADRLAEIDDWLDSGVSEQYEREPLGQHWARVAKAGEEVGEAIEKLIAWTGQNPRKPQRDEAYAEMLDELADVAITAILGMQHFTKNAGETLALFQLRFEFLYARMQASILAGATNSQSRPGA